MYKYFTVLSNVLLLYMQYGNENSIFVFAFQ